MHITGTTTISYVRTSSVWRITIDGKPCGPSLDERVNADVICDWLRDLRTMIQKGQEGAMSNDHNLMSDESNREHWSEQARGKAALLREAFLSGFFVSRQGYNGEYAAEHLAPESVTRISSCDMEDMEELEALADKYIALVSGTEESIG